MADQLTRRTTLAGGAGLAAVLPVLAACGGGDSGSGSGSGSEPAGTGAGASESLKPGTVVATTGEIPVGAGKIFTDLSVVVTQPEAGTFKAFSSICTHRGCPVSSVEGGTINCGCHFSKFSIADGSVEGGPAPRPLPSIGITVAGDEITLA